MKNFKYFPISEAQKRWSIYLTDCGKETIPARYKNYPPPDTPLSRTFTWQEGRILDDYYLVYIVKGEGFYENQKTGLQKVKAGTAFIVFAQEWYRHRPDPKTGWESLWIGFQGDYINRLVPGFISPDQPIFVLNRPVEFEMAMRDFVEGMVEAPLEYPLSTGGEVLALLGRLLELKEMNEPGTKYFYAVRKAQAHILRHAFETIDYHRLAQQIGVSETTFRRAFLKLAHQTPLQFQLAIRLKHACKLLEETDFPIAEIAQKVGFDLHHYFTRLFKEKLGCSPTYYKDRHTRRTNTRMVLLPKSCKK
jgi:AraC-like DNA-binding protein